MIYGKKGDLLLFHWVELYTVFMLVLGFVLSFVIRNATFSYVVISLAGFFAGRQIYIRKRHGSFHRYLSVFGFIVGYAIGALFNVGVTVKWVVFLFIVFSVASYYIHDKGLLE